MTPSHSFADAIRMLDSFSRVELSILGSLIVAYPSHVPARILYKSRMANQKGDPKNLLRVLIWKLRKKLPPGMAIVTVKHGYKLEYV